MQSNREVRAWSEDSCLRTSTSPSSAWERRSRDGRTSASSSVTSSFFFGEAGLFSDVAFAGVRAGDLALEDLALGAGDFDRARAGDLAGVATFAADFSAFGFAGLAARAGDLAAGDLAAAGDLERPRAGDFAFFSLGDFGAFSFGAMAVGTSEFQKFLTFFL